MTKRKKEKKWVLSLKKGGCKGKEGKKKKQNYLALPSSLHLSSPLVVASYSPLTSAAATCLAPLHFLSSFSPPPFFISLLLFPFSFNFERRERLLVKEGFDFRKERGTLSGIWGLLKEQGRDCLWAGHGLDFIRWAGP